MNKLKIIFCTDGIFPHQVGGMQRHSRLLIEELARTGKVELIVIHPHAKNVFSDMLHIKEICISPIRTNRNYLLECYRYSKRIYEILIKHSEYTVYAQGLTVWYNIKKIKSKIIVNPHGLEAYQAITRKDKLISIPFKWIFNYIFKNADAVISLGGKLTDILLEHVGKEAIAVIPNAVTEQAFAQGKKNTGMNMRALFVARFAANKGIHVLLQAIRELNEEGWEDKLTFLLGGKGPLFEFYSKEYCFKNVKYLGFVSDEKLEELYATSDLFVFPTLFEGMPTVVLEAMSFGLPVVVSNVGATAEIVDSSNGYLIEKDNVNELKLAISEFYNLTPQKKHEMSLASLRKIETNFNWKIIAQKHIDLFKLYSTNSESNLFKNQP